MSHRKFFALLFAFVCFFLVCYCEEVAVSLDGSVLHECPEIEEQLHKLNFVNHYANEMQEGLFYKSVKPRKTLPSKELLYFNSNLATDLGLNVDQYLGDDNCKEALLKYLSFELLIPGSKPIAVPHSEYRYINKDKKNQFHGSLLPERNPGVLLGTIEHNGKTLDLLAKGIGNIPFTGLSDGFLSLQRATFEMLIGEAVNATKVNTVQTLAMIISHEAYEEGIGRDSNVIVIQAAPTFLRMGSIEYFVHQNRLDDANKVLTFVQKHFYPDVPLADDHWSNCRSDDDDDEEDDDEFCYRKGTNVLLGELAIAYYENVQALGHKAFQIGLVSSGTFGVDGTMLEFQLARFKEWGGIDVMKCGSVDERSGHAETAKKFRFLQTIYPVLAQKLGFSKALIKKLNDGFKQHFGTEEIRITNQRYGFVSPNYDDTVKLRAFEGIKACSYVDWMIFLRELGNIQPIATTTLKQENSMDETVWKGISSDSSKMIRTWELWIEDYRGILREQGLDPVDRKKYVESFHPAFLPRTRIIIHAIRGIELDDFSMFYDLLEAVQKPFDTNVSITTKSLSVGMKLTKYFQVPENLTKSGSVFVFPCEEEDKYFNPDKIKPVSFNLIR